MSDQSQTATKADYGHLVGHRFPGGSFELAEYIAWLWADAVLAEPAADVAHPGLGYFVAMGGLGVSIQDIFDLIEADADSGVVFGETEIVFGGTLRPGTTYEVEGEIVDVERKSGKRAGVFDKLVFAVRVHEPGASEPVVTNTNTWIVPRKEGQ
jgi:hypothetical protein